MSQEIDFNKIEQEEARKARLALAMQFAVTIFAGEGAQVVANRDGRYDETNWKEIVAMNSFEMADAMIAESHMKREPAPKIVYTAPKEGQRVELLDGMDAGAIGFCAHSQTGIPHIRYVKAGSDLYSFHQLVPGNWRPAPETAIPGEDVTPAPHFCKALRPRDGANCREPHGHAGPHVSRAGEMFAA